MAAPPLEACLSRCPYSPSLQLENEDKHGALSISRAKAWHIGDLGRMPPGKKGRSEEQPPQTGGTDHSLRAALGPKFAHDGIDMEFNGVLTDVEAIGNGLVGQSLSHKLEHF
jgi:hypothetical protein